MNVLKIKGLDEKNKKGEHNNYYYNFYVKLIIIIKNG